MRTLTATHLAAQRVSPQRPRVSVLVRDKQARFSWIGTQATSNAQCSMAVVGATIVLVALSSGGAIRVRRVTDPTLLDPTGDPGVGWGFYTEDWTTVCTDALAFNHGDVALSNNSGTLRLFYIATDGSEIRCRTSVDGGVTWSLASVVKAVVGGSTGLYFKLASAGHDDVFWAHDLSGSRYVYFRAYSGGWGAEKDLHPLYRTGGQYVNCGGISALWNSTSSKYEVVASFWDTGYMNGEIASCHFNPGGDEGVQVSARQAIVPPGLASPGFSPLWPQLYSVPAALGGGYLLTYVDKFASGRLSWTSPVCIRSRDFDHWSYKIPLGFETSYSKRACACTLGGVVYVYVVNEAYELQLWSAGDAAMEMTELQARVVRYRIAERPGRGWLTVDLDNRDGRYDNPGVDGNTAEALRPLAQVVVKQGLRTSAGEETVECRPFFVWSVSNVRDDKRNIARVEAADGWRLFELWRPDAVYVFQSRSLRWCIEELAARVGYFEVDFDASTEWDMTVEYLAVAAQSGDWHHRTNIRAWDRWVPLDQAAVAFDLQVNGFSMLMQLLGLVGGVARWGNGSSSDVLYCLIPQTQGESPAAVHTYGDGEVISGEYRKGLAWPTRVRGAGLTVAYEGQDQANSLVAGMEFLQLLYAENWTTTAQCQMAVESALDDADARAYGGEVITRPNVGLEVFDIVFLSDSRAGSGFVSAKRRVNGIVTEYDPAKRVWEQRVALEQV